MEGMSDPQDAGAWRFRRLALAAALLVCCFAAILLSSAPISVRIVTSGVGMVGGSLAMSAGFLVRARRCVGRRRRAWTLWTFAALSSALSNLLLITAAASSRDQVPTSSNLAVAVALIIAVAGLATFPVARRRTTDIARMVLDGIVLGGSSLFVANVLLFPRILVDQDSQGAISLGLPVLDVVILTVASLLFFRGAPADRPTLGLAALGFVCLTCSDFSFAVRSGTDGLDALGSVTPIGWIAGYALIALAAYSPGSQAPPTTERPREASPVAGTAIMFSLFLVAAALSLVNLERRTLTPGSAALWLLVLLAVLARQIMLVVDNEQLRQSLERRVIERTRSLRKLAQQSDLLVNSVGDGIYGVNRDGVVTFINPAAARVLGYPPHELIGREAHAAFHGVQSDGTAFPVSTCYVTEAIRHQQTTSAEEDLYRRADGLSVPVEVTATPLVDDDRAIGAVVVFRDVTQRRDVDRMKSEFVSMVSHELRTPLTAIRGSLGLLAGGALGKLTAPAGRMVDIALLSSERLARLIDEILDIERIESGMLSMDLQTHRARDLIDLAVGQLQVIAEQAGIRVSLGRIEGEVYADADRVVQTLVNVLSNAIKFSQRGGLVLVEAEPRGGFVEFAIRDDGRGIPEEKLDSIFFRFEQVDSSDAREKGGTGLGLSISRSIVERLGGRIWAINNPGPGATFLFTLPSAQDFAAAEPVSTPYAEEPAEPAERTRRGGPLGLSEPAEQNPLIRPVTL
jgi:PAS domain S-box-containing protein